MRKAPFHVGVAEYSLPARHRRIPQQPEHRAASPEGKRILLVEDNELNQKIAAEILQEAGFAMESTADGAVAVEKMKNARPLDGYSDACDERL